MHIKKIKFIPLLLLLFSMMDIYGEIQYVTLQWTPGQCELDCVSMVTKKLSAIPGVASVSVSPDLGEAKLQWKPNMKFSYKEIDFTMREVGLANRVTHIRVLGTIIHDNSSVTLVSLGDYTPFKLLGNLEASSIEYVNRHNPLSYPLSPLTRDRLLQIQENSKTVIIQGRLFDPYRYFFTQYLIVDSIDVPKT